jgi:arginyl-tRNA synthetase
MELEKILLPNTKLAVQKLFGAEIDDAQIQFQKTRKDFEGDITLVVFPFSKIAKKSPIDTGNIIGTYLQDNCAEIKSFNTVQGFLNLVVHDGYWLNQLSEINQVDNFGLNLNGEEQVMVEYSSPNTNKPLHLGHLRNNFLGYSVSKILAVNNKEVIKTQIVNDRGIHICKSMLAWSRYGNGESPNSTGLKGDKLVGKYYVIFDQKLKEQTKEVLNDWNSGVFNVPPQIQETFLNLKSAAAEKKEEKAKQGIIDKINKLANNWTPIMIDVQEMLQKWEAGDEDVKALWSKMNNWVYEGFDLTYKSMGVSFDKIYYESKTYITGKELVEDGLAKGIFFKKDDGSVWIDLTAEGLDEKLVLRGDGTAVYITQDIGTAQQRMMDYPHLNGMVYTVGNEQDYHFKVLFLILQKLGYQWANNCFHLSYGMVDLPTGKMKSREGTVVDADDLIEEVVAKAKELTKERGQIEGMSQSEKENLYRMIGLGGLKYYLLKVDPSKRMLFNPEESVDLNGNTGPFIQYTHARISTLLNKAERINKVDLNCSLLDSEKEVLKHLLTFPEVISNAGKEFSPALIANFTYELVKLYNTFYQSVSIFKEEDEAIKNVRLVLSKNVAKIIKNAMNLLGIEVPTRM